jgi:hypothetical protein
MAALGSISEVITLDTPCSGIGREAELICSQILSVFSSQFGQMPTINGHVPAVMIGISQG